MSTQTKKGAFPFALHDILEQAERQGYEDIISWTPCGTALLVHRREAFIARQFFELTKYKSFSRQLNLWGFTCIGTGLYHGAYTHPSFVRGNREGCRHIVRQKKNKTGKMAMTSTSKTCTSKAMETISQRATPVDPLEDTGATTTAAVTSSNITSRINEANALITSDILKYMAQQPDDIFHPETETASNHDNVEMPPTAARTTAKDLDMNDDWVDDLFALPSNNDFFTSSLDHFCFTDLEFEGEEFTL